MSHSKYVMVGLAWAIGSLAQANDDLPSFDAVRQRLSETSDLTRVSHLYRRCAALNLNVAALLVNKKQAKASRDYENLANHYMLMSEAVDKEVDQQRGTSTAKPMQVVSYDVQHIAAAYQKRMSQNQKERGESIAGDAKLEGELAECLKPDAFAKKLGR